MRYLIYLLYFLSGLSALVYEVVWLRKLELVFGTTTYAVSTVLAVFFTGLAAGSFLFGKLVDPASRIQTNDKRMGTNDSFKLVSIRTNSLLVYALLELGIGLYAVFTPWIFTGIEQAQASIWQQFAPGFGGFSLLTFGLSFVGLFVPTVLMGGTFPVAVKATTRILTNHERMGTNVISSDSLRIGSNSRVIGLLYGLNTLGAVLGVLAAGFWLIASIGVNQTIWVAAGISLIVGVIAIYMTSVFTNDLSFRRREATEKSH